jgi:hypothetical protein
MVPAAHSNAAILPPHELMAGRRCERVNVEMDMAPPIKMVGNPLRCTAALVASAPYFLILIQV